MKHRVHIIFRGITGRQHIEHNERIASVFRNVAAQMKANTPTVKVQVGPQNLTTVRTTKELALHDAFTYEGNRMDVPGIFLDSFHLNGIDGRPLSTQYEIDVQGNTTTHLEIYANFSQGVS